MKVISTLVLVALAALGLAACGGDKESASTESATPISEAKAPAAKESQGSQTSDAAKSSGKEDDKAVRQNEEREARDFTPQHHHDSGGGSGQFREKGGDNSVQEYGAESAESEFEEAAAAMHGYFDARAAANWAASCTYLSKSAVEQAGKIAEANGQQPKNQGCAAVMEAIWAPAIDSRLKAEAKEANAGSLRVEGDHGFLIYHGFEGKRELLQMQKEAGRWRLAGLEGYPF